MTYEITFWKSSSIAVPRHLPPKPTLTLRRQWRMRWRHEVSWVDVLDYDKKEKSCPCHKSNTNSKSLEKTMDPNTFPGEPPPTHDMQLIGNWLKNKTKLAGEGNERGWLLLGVRGFTINYQATKRYCWPRLLVGQTATFVKQHIGSTLHPWILRCPPMVRMNHVYCKFQFYNLG